MYGHLRHRQHKADIQRSEYCTGDQTKKNFRHMLGGFSEKATRSQYLTCRNNLLERRLTLAVRS